MMAKKDIHYLKYLAEKSDENEISAAERKLLDNFIRHEYDNSEWDVAQMGSKKTISSRIYHNIKGLKTPKISFLSYYKYLVAATIAVIVCVGLLLRQQTHFKEFVFTTSSVADSVKLSDSSVIYLAANSALKYPEYFRGKNRLVSLLKGNAFFKVAKDPSRPFIVSSAQMKTRVLGTSFHISLDKHKSSVTVITGKVSVYTKQQTTFLKPNERAVLTESVLTKQKVSDLSLYSWYKKDMQLNNVSLAEVFILLNFKYGVGYKTEDKTGLSTRMTIYLKEGLSLQDVLDQINYITNLKLKLHGNTIALNH